MPVPFYLGEIEWAPVMRLAFLTSLLSLVMVTLLRRRRIELVPA